jgi:hypothetical protein
LILLRAFVEETLRGRLDTVRAAAELGDVEVHLEDALLAPGQLYHDGDAGLETLAKPALPGPQEQVLGDLLRDRAGAAHAPAALTIGERLVDLFQIEPAVLREALVLSGHHGECRLARDLVPVAPLVPELIARLACDERSRCGFAA